MPRRKEQVCMPKSDYVEEHQRLIRLLEAAGKEGEDQKAELKHQMSGGACWEGYEMIGMKEKNGRKVPNCVPTSAETKRIRSAYKTLRGGKMIKVATSGATLPPGSAPTTVDRGAYVEYLYPRDWSIQQARNENWLRQLNPADAAAYREQGVTYQDANRIAKSEINRKNAEDAQLYNNKQAEEWAKLQEGRAQAFRERQENDPWYKVMKGLTTVTDIAADVLSFVPGIGGIASAIYQSLAPPGSKFYSTDNSAAGIAGRLGMNLGMVAAGAALGPVAGVLAKGVKAVAPKTAAAIGQIASSTAKTASAVTNAASRGLSTAARGVRSGVSATVSRPINAVRKAVGVPIKPTVPKPVVAKPGPLNPNAMSKDVQRSLAVGSIYAGVTGALGDYKNDPYAQSLQWQNVNPLPYDGQYVNQPLAPTQAPVVKPAPTAAASTTATTGKGRRKRQQKKVRF